MMLRVTPIDTINEMTTSDHVEGLRRWAHGNRETLALIWSKYDDDGDWPNASLHQRELFASGRRLNFERFAREMPPALEGLDSVTGKLGSPLGACRS